MWSARFAVTSLLKHDFRRFLVQNRVLNRLRVTPLLSVNVYKPSVSANQRRFVFTHRQLCSRRDYDDHDEDTKRLLANLIQRDSRVENAIFIGCFGFLLVLGWVGYEYLYKPTQRTIEKLIVQAMIADKNGHPGEAEQLYHQALSMSQTQQNMDGIIYVYDQMANLEMKRGHYKKAEVLFKECLKGLLSTGTSKDDNAVIEISLKLSQIYAHLKRHVEASAGYTWCIETTTVKISEMPEDDIDKNTLSLLGLCWNSYAYYLLSQKRFAEAEQAYKKALTLCENQLTVDGLKHPQTVTILNDLGTVCDEQQKFDDAYEYLQQAVSLAEKVSHSDVPRLLCNMGSIQMHRGNCDDSKECYSNAMKQAVKDEDVETINYINDSLMVLEKSKKKK
ncbi:tetratricopeptide repeat protein 19, mitochondrial-like [Saccoglossus kowalevskii]|uniref:Tetratricopeptide repeat protein 19, mitochondrial-like n=1 Tax=Saccoglossus kowalevskii TaxID=10224 RepID=A0ABM0GU04_SACKO|nr:PREDICTED: tetratricopeptide repeat protein 19, mitochondrial-like [Saccoglossus kowalevskii]